jgi:hypothetical protein
MSVRESTFLSVASVNHVDQNTLAKVTRRLIPFLFACYVLNFVDRTNVGFAKLHLQNSLGFSDAVYGLGVSLFRGLSPLRSSEQLAFGPVRGPEDTLSHYGPVGPCVDRDDVCHDANPILHCALSAWTCGGGFCARHRSSSLFPSPASSGILSPA